MAEHTAEMRAHQLGHAEKVRCNNGTRNSTALTPVVTPVPINEDIGRIDARRCGGGVTLTFPDRAGAYHKHLSERRGSSSPVGFDMADEIAMNRREVTTHLSIIAEVCERLNAHDTTSISLESSSDEDEGTDDDVYVALDEDDEQEEEERCVMGRLGDARTAVVCSGGTPEAGTIDIARMVYSTMSLRAINDKRDDHIKTGAMKRRRARDGERSAAMASTLASNWEHHKADRECGDGSKISHKELCRVLGVSRSSSAVKGVFGTGTVDVCAVRAMLPDLAQRVNRVVDTTHN